MILNGNKETHAIWLSVNIPCLRRGSYPNESVPGSHGYKGRWCWRWTRRWGFPRKKITVTQDETVILGLVGRDFGLAHTAFSLDIPNQRLQCRLPASGCSPPVPFPEAATRRRFVLFRSWIHRSLVRRCGACGTAAIRRTGSDSPCSCSPPQAVAPLVNSDSTCQSKWTGGTATAGRPHDNSADTQ